VVLGTEIAIGRCRRDAESLIIRVSIGAIAGFIVRFIIQGGGFGFVSNVKIEFRKNGKAPKF
jgi:hypothetical protein